MLSEAFSSWVSLHLRSSRCQSRFSLCGAVAAKVGIADESVRGNGDWRSPNCSLSHQIQRLLSGFRSPPRSFFPPGERASCSACLPLRRCKNNNNRRSIHCCTSMLWMRERSSCSQLKNKKIRADCAPPCHMISRVRWRLSSQVMRGMQVVAHYMDLEDELAQSPPAFPGFGALALGWKPVLRFFPLEWERCYSGNERITVVLGLLYEALPRCDPVVPSHCCWGTVVIEIAGIAHRFCRRVGDGLSLPSAFSRVGAPAKRVSLGPAWAGSGYVSRVFLGDDTCLRTAISIGDFGWGSLSAHGPGSIRVGPSGEERHSPQCTVPVPSQCKPCHVRCSSAQQSPAGTHLSFFRRFHSMCFYASWSLHHPPVTSRPSIGLTTHVIQNVVTLGAFP